MYSMVKWVACATLGAAASYCLVKSVSSNQELKSVPVTGKTSEELSNRLKQGATALGNGEYKMKMGEFAGFLVKHVVWAGIGIGFQKAFSVATGSNELYYSDFYKRFLVWNLLFEVSGFGCNAGCGGVHRYFQFLTPGTLKYPLMLDQREGPVLSPFGARRTGLDIAIFLSYVGSCLYALTRPVVTSASVYPVLASLFLGGISDQVMFLSSRGEVYGWMVTCVALGNTDNDIFTGIQCVQLGIWLWAGISKLGPWFPYAVQTMLSNSALLPVRTFKMNEKLYEDFPNHDFRPSAICKILAWAGTIQELAFPLMIAQGNEVGMLGHAIASAFHVFIWSQFAAGTPQEWNIFTMVGSLYLFGYRGHQGVSLETIAALPLALKSFLFFAEVFLPALGTFFPSKVSFLVAMRYYAGNWPATVYLVKKDAWCKFDEMKPVFEPYKKAYLDPCGPSEDETGQALGSYEFLTWRCMHLHGRLVSNLIMKALGDDGKLEDYHVVPGLMLSNTFYGFGFGDGNMADSWFAQQLQEKCQFKPREAFLISMDSTPTMLSPVIPCQIRDVANAKKVVFERDWPISQAEQMQPY
jgi:hypothetical protein